MIDVYCPYCDAGQEINHDDGYGYDEYTRHQQECVECSKTFVFETETTVNHCAYPADCLNGGEHKYESTCTIPIEFTKMKCSLCYDERAPTTKELNKIIKSRKGVKI